MYASDYPHSECQFPNSVDNILSWTRLGAETQRKLLWDNAARLYKQTKARNLRESQKLVPPRFVTPAYAEVQANNALGSRCRR
jgi:hypothetical protein